jgi:hypothetical protein
MEPRSASVMVANVLTEILENLSTRINGVTYDKTGIFIIKDV